MEATAESPVESFILFDGGLESKPFTWNRMESKDVEVCLTPEDCFLRERAEWFLDGEVVQSAWMDDVLGVFRVEEYVTVVSIKAGNPATLAPIGTP